MCASTQTACWTGLHRHIHSETVTERFERTWAVVTGALCVLVMLGLAFTGPVALIPVAVILALSVGLRRLVMLVARHRHASHWHIAPTVLASH